MNTILKKFAWFYDNSYETRLKHFKVSSILFKTLKLLSFGLLWFVSLNLSLELFKELGSSGTQSGFFVLVAIGLETSKVIALILAKSEIEAKRIKNFIIGIGYFILFSGLAFVSIYTSYGFVLTAIEETSISVIATSNTVDIEYYQTRYDELEEKIRAYMPQLERSDLSINSKTSIERQIKDWEAQRDEAFTTIRTLQKESAITASNSQATTMFTLMARDMGVDEKLLRFWIMIIMVFVIEACITVMAPTINIIEPKKDVENNHIGHAVAPIESSTLTTTPAYTYTETTMIQPDKELPKPPKIKRKYTKSKMKTKPKDTPKVEPKPKSEIVDVPVEIPESVKQESLRETLFEKFVKCLYNNGTYSWLKEKEDVAKELHVPTIKISQYHNLLSTFKGAKGYTLIEFRKDTGHWHPNVTESVVINLYKEGKLKLEEENHASEA